MRANRAVGFLSLLAGMSVACSLDPDVDAKFLSVTNRPVSSSARQVAAVIKTKIAGLSEEDFKVHLRRQYVKLHFVDRDGRWLLPELENLAERLIPENIPMESIDAFIDEMAIAMETNPYMMAFLDAAIERSFPTLQGKFASEGHRVIPESVAYAFALEAFTQAQLEYPSLIGVVNRFWKEERRRAGMSMRQTGIFGLVKLLSVEKPIQEIVEFHETRQVDPKFLRGFLSLNIFEAIVADRVTGYYDNANAGWPLMINRAGDTTPNENLGTGPAEFTDDGKKILIRYPLPKQWDDLYQVWNMAFCSRISTYPMWVSKLLIPQMSHYERAPTEYIYRRTLTLYTTIHYIHLSKIEDERDGISSIDWVDKDFTDLWGSVNVKSAEDYVRQVKDAQ